VTRPTIPGIDGRLLNYFCPVIEYGCCTCREEKIMEKKEVSGFQTIDAVLDFAIKKEEEASAFYSKWSETVDSKSISDALAGFAKEEQKHKALILEVKGGKKLDPPKKSITNLKISDYLEEAAPSKDMGFQDALILAMKREKESFDLYSGLASMAEDESIKNLFDSLAREEAKHKLRLETIYDESILKEN
jgi:rubrerythrin